MRLYFSEQLLQRRVHIRVWLTVVCVTALAALVACIVCCCLCTTATAAKMEQTAVLISNFAGWVVIYALTAQVLPQRHALQHEQNVLNAAWETVTGRITLEHETLQIPKSISIRKVSVDSGDEVCRLSIRADKADMLRELDGHTLSLQVAYGYITAFEETPDAHE